MSRSKASLLGGVLPIAVILVAPPATAQPVGQYLLDRYFPEGVPGYSNELGVTVQSRVRPDFDAIGVRAGSFIVRPQASEAVGYNDNVLGNSTGRPGSWLANSQASLGVTSDWGRDSLAASINVDDTRYASLASQNTTIWSATLNGTYDIGTDQARLGYTHLSSYQLPTSIDSRGITVPDPFDLDNAHIGYVTKFGRFSVLPQFDFTALRYSPASFGVGPKQSQSFDNRNIYLGALETRYEFSPQRNAVLVISGIGTDYVSATAAVPTHNSTGYAVLAGLDYAANGVWRIRGLVGYEVRDFENSEFQQRSSPVGEINLIWTPTGLTTVTGRVARTIEDSGSSTVSGYNYTSAQLSVDHEYLRNVLLRSYVGFQRANYVGTTATQTFYQFGLSATWLLNRNMRLGVSYNVLDQTGDTGSQPLTSPVKGGTYLQNITLLQFRFQL